VANSPLRSENGRVLIICHVDPKKLVAFNSNPLLNTISNEFLISFRSKYIAASFVENLSFDERVIYSNKSHKNAIVLWDYDDIHSYDPVLILLSPLEITCFAFNPKGTLIFQCILRSKSYCRWCYKWTNNYVGS